MPSVDGMTAARESQSITSRSGSGPCLGGASCKEALQQLSMLVRQVGGWKLGGYRSVDSDPVTYLLGSNNSKQR